MIDFFLPHRKEGEHINILVRAHPIVIFIKIILWLVVAILPLGLYAMLVTNAAFDQLLTNQIVWAFIILFASIYYLFVWLMMLYSFMMYYLGVWIVTTHRIISIEQNGLFDHVVSEQELYRVQDVTSEVKGILGTLFNYGYVDVQTAGKEERFTFEQIPDPSRVVKQITTIVEEYKKAHPENINQTITSGV